MPLETVERENCPVSGVQLASTTSHSRLELFQATGWAMTRTMLYTLVLVLGSACLPSHLIGQSEAADSAAVKPLGDSNEVNVRLEARQQLPRWLAEAERYHSGREFAKAGLNLMWATGAYVALGLNDSARLTVHRAIREMDATGDSYGAALALNWAGVLYQRLRQYDSALTFHGKALSALEKAGDQVHQAATLERIAMVLDDMSLRDSAITRRRLAVGLWPAPLGMTSVMLRFLNLPTAQDGMLNTLLRLESAFARRQDFDSAAEYGRVSVALSSAFQDDSAAAIRAASVASYFRLAGHVDSALAYDFRALALKEANGDRRGAARTRRTIGSMYTEIGKPDSALRYLREALGELRAVHDTLGELLAHDYIGLAFFNARSIPGIRNEAYLDSAAAHWRFAMSAIGPEPSKRDHKDLLALLVHNIGSYHQDAGHLDSALTYSLRALKLHQDLGDRRNEASTLNNLGWLYAEGFQQPRRALTYYNRAMPLLRRHGRPHSQAQTLANMALAYRALREPRVALAYYDTASALFYHADEMAGDDPNQLSARELSARLYGEWSLTWLDAVSSAGIRPPHAVFASLAAAERGRAQALLKLMRRTDSIAPGGDLAAEGRQLVHGVTRSGATLLVMVPTEQQLLIWVGRSDSVSVIQVRVSYDSLVHLVGEARRLLGPVVDLERCDSTDEGELGSEPKVQIAFDALADAVLPSELLRQLPRAGELVIVPQGVLQLVPFATLRTNERGVPLGSRYALRYAPALRVLAQSEAAAGKSRVGPREWRGSIVVGNPTMPKVRACNIEEYRPDPLPEAGVFSDSLARGMGVASLQGNAAAETSVRRHLEEAPLIHLATHGYAYQAEGRSRDSWVALASDAHNNGLFTVGEILDGPPLSADLVVLAACVTGLGESKEAEGTVGFQRAFLAKGAKSVLVSLWTVDEAATVRLLQVFYREWLAPDPPSKAEALRRAQDAVRTDPSHPRWRHPAFWAGFQLVGAP